MDNWTEIFIGKRILITGSTGFMATSLASRLKDLDCSIIRLSRPGANFVPMVSKAQIENVECDICRPETWQTILPNVDDIFHFAGQTSLYDAEKQPLVDWEYNVLPMIHMADACKKLGVFPNIIFAGTVTEAGLTDRLPVDETHPDLPASIYDIHKLMAEQYLEYYSRAGILNGTTLRLANVYGPGASKNADRGVLNRMIRKALNGEALTIYGDGKFLRDYVFIEDVVNAFLAASVHIDSIKGQHFIIGSQERYTIADAFDLIAKRVALRTGVRVPLAHVAFPEGLSPIESRNFAANVNRFYNATGWQARVSLEDGIDRTIESFMLPYKTEVKNDGS